MFQMRTSNCVLALFFCLFAVTATAATAKRATARRCGVKQDQLAQRIFADPDGKHGWHEYRRLTDVPQLEAGFGELARVWKGNDGNLLITMEEPGEDFAAYH